MPTTYRSGDYIKVYDDDNNLISRTYSPLDSEEVDEPVIDSAIGTSGELPSMINPMGISYATAEEAALDRSGTLDMAKGLIKVVPDTVVAIPELLAMGVDIATGTTKIAPTMRSEYNDILDSVGLLPETEYGEVANLTGILTTGVLSGIRYANAASRAANNQKVIDTIADAASVRGVSPASVRQIDDIISEGAKKFSTKGPSPITGLGSTRKKVPVGTSILPMIMSAEKLGRTKLGQKIFAGEGVRGNIARALGTSGAIGVADFTLAPDGVPTIADHFDSLPNFMKSEDPYTFAEEDSGFTGREDAFRRGRNKLRFAGEGLLIGGVLDIGLNLISPIAKLLKTPAKKVKEGVETGVSTTAKTLDIATGKILSTGYQKLTDSAVAGRLKGFGGRYLTTSRGLRDDIFEDLSDLGNVITDSDRDIGTQLALYGKATQDARDALAPLGVGKKRNQEAYVDLEDYLEAQIPLSLIQEKYGATAAKAAQRMKNQRDKFSTQLSDFVTRQFEDGIIDAEVAGQLIRDFAELDGKYLQRSFTAGIARSDMSAFKALPDFTTAVDEVVRAINGLKRGDPEFELLQGLSGPELREFAEEYVSRQLALERFDTPGAGDVSAASKFADAAKDNRSKLGIDILDKASRKSTDQAPLGRVPSFRMNENMMKTRSKILNNSPFLRTLMGENTARGYQNPGELLYVSDAAKKLIKKPNLTAEEVVSLRITDTMSDLAKSLTTLNFYKQLLDDPSISISYANIRQGDVPYIVKDVDPGDNQARSLLMDAGYVPIPQGSGTVFGGSYGPLSGTFMKPEFFTAITQPQRIGSFGGHVWDSLVQLKGASQMSKTVLSFATQARNFHSVPMFLAANGNILRGASLEDSVLLAANKVMNFSDDEFNEFMKYLGRSGLIEQGPALQEFKAMLGHVKKEMRDPKVQRRGLARLTEMTGEQIAKLPGGGQVLNAASAPIKALIRAYRFSDDLTKTASLLAERGKYAAALRNPLNDVLGFGDATAENFDLLMPALYAQKVTKRLGSRTIEQGSEAIVGPYRTNFDIFMGDIVSDTVPNYGRTYEAAQKIARFPFFGNFVAFSSENIRNSVNIFNQGYAELSFKKSPELIEGFRGIAARHAYQTTEGITEEAVSAAMRAGEFDDVANQMADKFVKEMNAIGLRRLMGYVATTQILGRSTGRAMTSATGSTPEEVEAIRVLNPEYMKGATIAIMSNNKNGRVEFTNLSTNLPYDMSPLVGDSARAAIRTFRINKDELGEGNYLSTSRALYDYLFRNLRVFGEEGILSDAIADVTLRSGRSDRGLVYTPTMSEEEKREAITGHLFGALTPTLVQEFMRVNASGISPGRLTAAAKGQTYTGGETPELQKEFFRMVFGLTTHKMNVPLIVAYEMAAYNKGESSIKRGAYKALLVSRPAETIQDFKEDVLQAQENLFRLQQEKHRKLKAAGVLGVGYRQAKKAIEAQNIRISEDEFKAIQRGQFSPLILNDQRDKQIINQQRTFDIDKEISPRELKRSIKTFNRFAKRRLKGLPLTQPFPYRDQKAEDVLGSVIPSSLPESGITQLNTQNPAPELALSSPEAPVAPAPVAPVQAGEPVSPGLLGDNPVEIVRNLELAQRTRRGA